MSLPPQPRVPGAASRRRAREVTWWLAIVVLLLMCGWVLTPEPLQAAMKSRVARWCRWSTPPVEKEVAHDEMSGLEWSLRLTSEAPHEEPLITPAFTPPAVSTTESRALHFPEKQRGRRVTPWAVMMREVTATVVSSPVYQIAGGGKRFTPRRWVRVTVDFTAIEAIPRLALVYEINLGAGGRYTGAILHENLLPYQSGQAVAYLVPARARLVGERIAGVRVTAYSEGNLLEEAELGRPGRFDDAGITGFLRPKSLTPFAPLDWDAYFPDSGFAEKADIEDPSTQRLTNQTSTGTTSPTR